MSLTANSSQESARRKSFMNSTYIMSNQTFLGSGDRNDSHSHQLARIGGKKIFEESRNHTFLGSGDNIMSTSARRKFWSHQFGK